MTALGGEAVGKPGVAGVYTNQRLNFSAPWEGLRMACQGFKPGSGNPTVRHYRGASGTVRHGETVTPSRNRKSGHGNPSPVARRARFLSQPHAAFDVAGTGNVAWSRCCDTSQPKGRGNREHKLRPKPARQSPTLLLGGRWKRRHHSTPATRHRVTRPVRASILRDGGVRRAICSATRPQRANLGIGTHGEFLL